MATSNIGCLIINGLLAYMFNDVEQDKHSVIIGNVFNHGMSIKRRVHTTAHFMHIG